MSDVDVFMEFLGYYKLFIWGARGFHGKGKLDETSRVRR
jgi:hypothetical protein